MSSTQYARDWRVIRTYLALLACVLPLVGVPVRAAESLPGGALKIHVPDGKPALVCPLRHTEVKSEIAGFVARTTVRQVFHNPLDHKIEATYVFPLPEASAVDSMTMIVDGRRIVGKIKERNEARRIYDAARAAGHVSSLLDQERPNIFTQSVANIEAGAEVVIEIGYVETLEYEDGTFEWVFPTVVGPRYIPGGGSAPDTMTIGRPTAQVPDGDRITPPVAPQGMRSGHDISITVNLRAGTELFDLQSVLHEIDVHRAGRSAATVTLRNQAAIPNRDFVLRYRIATERIGHAFLTHRDDRGEFFTLVLQPPARVSPEQVAPRELIFVLDTSGSMRGFPIDRAKELMTRLIDTMNGADTFNLITFAGQTRILWDDPRHNTARNRHEAQAFLASRQGGGGTEMMRAIHAALTQRGLRERDRMRIVVFMTDGYVGNDMAIIGAVRRNADTTRVFSFGVGNSANRYLLDGMAHAGRGEVEYVTLASEGEAAVERFHQRLLAPVLTDIEIDWGTLPVADVYPRRVPDLFAAKPIMVHGRLTGRAAGTITLRGKNGEGRFEKQIVLRSETRDTNDGEALASLWARAKVGALMNHDLAALQQDRFPEELKRQITELGIRFRLMTQFTSFVAVEELIITSGGEPKKVLVPVEVPDGVSYDGVFGRSGGAARKAVYRSMKSSSHSSLQMAAPAPTSEPPPEEWAGTPGHATMEKLAEPLRDLADKVARQRKDGDLIIDGIAIVDYEVEVMVTLSDLSDETMRAISELGFVVSGESKLGRILVGRIDVRKLEDLARSDAVVAVRPV